MKNRVRESRTLGSVRGGAGRLWSPLHGHEAGNGGYAPSECPTVATSSLLLGDRKVAGSNPVAPTILKLPSPEFLWWRVSTPSEVGQPRWGSALPDDVKGPIVDSALL